MFLNPDYADVIEAENFNPNNPFHVALKKYGKYTYDRVIEHATVFHLEAIAEARPVVFIAEEVKKKALEIFADERYMRGMQLEEDLGL